MLGFFLSFLHVLNIWNGNVALNVSLIDMILVVLIISLTVFPLLLFFAFFFLFFFFCFWCVCIYIYIIYKIVVNPKRYTGIDWYLKYIIPIAKSVQPRVQYWLPYCKQLQENSIVTKLVLLKYNVNIDSTFPKRQFFLERVYKKERNFIIIIIIIIISIIIILLNLLWNINGDFHLVVT